MIVEKPKMPLWQKIFYIISAIFLIGAFIYLGNKNYKVNEKIKAEIIAINNNVFFIVMFLLFDLVN